MLGAAPPKQQHWRSRMGTFCTPLHELTFVTGCSNFKLGSVKGSGCGGSGGGSDCEEIKKGALPFADKLIQILVM